MQKCRLYCPMFLFLISIPAALQSSSLCHTVRMDANTTGRRVRLHIHLEKIREKWHISHAYRSCCCRQKRRFEDARDLLASALRLRPRESDLRMELASTFWHMNQQADAEALVRAGLALDPNNPELLALLERILKTIVIAKPGRTMGEP